MPRRRLRVGVVGAGLIAQVMHLHYLKELDELFDLCALCDASREVTEACAARFEIEKTCTDWRQIVEQNLDAVLVLTSGSHAPIAVAASQSGKHVFVEKPMCFSVTEGREMLEAAARANVILMVGYPKRYDPAYRRASDEVRRLPDLRFVRLTTMESPFKPYVSHYPLVKANDIDPAQLAQWRADAEQTRVCCNWRRRGSRSTHLRRCSSGQHGPRVQLVTGGSGRANRAQVCEHPGHDDQCYF